MLFRSQRVSRAAAELLWQATPELEGAVYRVTVTTLDMTPVASSDDLSAPVYSIPRATLDALPGGTRLLWQREARTRDGRTPRSHPATLARVNDHVPVPPPHQPRQRYWRLVARASVLAAGAIERPIAFGGNDLPGVMLASAVRTYLTRYAVTPGRRVAVFTNNDDGWRTVAALKDSGVTVAALVDARRQSHAEQIALANAAGAPLFNGLVTTAKGGKHGIASISVTRHDGGSQVVATDCLAVSGGWNPNIGLATHHGHRPRWNADIHAFVPSTPPPGLTVPGAASG